MARRWMSPKAIQQLRHDDVLLRLRQAAQRSSRPAALKEHGVPLVVSFEKTHCRIAIPEAQACNLLLGFPMRHANLQNRGRAVREPGRRYPCATHVRTIERMIERKGPTLSQIVYNAGHSCQPGSAFRRVAAVCREPGRNRTIAHSEPVNRKLFQKSNFAWLPAAGTCLKSLPTSMTRGCLPTDGQRASPFPFGSPCATKFAQ